MNWCDKWKDKFNWKCYLQRKSIRITFVQSSDFIKTLYLFWIWTSKFSSIFNPQIHTHTHVFPQFDMTWQSKSTYNINNCLKTQHNICACVFQECYYTIYFHLKNKCNYNVIYHNHSKYNLLLCMILLHKYK